jgi:transcription elongation factor GreA
MANAKEVFVTAEGLEEMKNELEYLKNTKRPEVINALKEARALGDLSENAEYDAARNEQAEVEGKIKELELLIENAKVISEVSKDKITVGSNVKIEYIDDSEIEQYTIVGSKEADPFANKISNESPLAASIIGKKVNEIVTVDSPSGKYKVKIVEIF